MSLDLATRREIETKLVVHGGWLKRSDQPPFTDAGLWEYCRQLSRGELGEQIDPDLLPAFRVAFDHGFQPATVDLTATMSRLRDMGFYAEVVSDDRHSSLVAGRWPHHGGATDPWPVSAGPGWIGLNSVLAHTDLLTVEPIAAAASSPVPPGTTASQLATAIVRVLNQNPDQWHGQKQTTTVDLSPFPASQSAPGADTLSLIHDGRHLTEIFQQQLTHLLDDLFTDRSPRFGQHATVFSEIPRHALVSKTNGLIIRRNDSQLVFSDGHTTNCDSILSIHLHLT
ncbi:hypothetical protein DMB66_47185 [Actinoplanes sp. ATCC 53533]|uniref:hypothetical protein n=1 Tax=Actinoplanes sp. ATCC 53533 TaxID=1288362 RepID=UPI000F7B083F|nr:hypothetical protein [Actinoplanes sp. ATCC 53533]RSM47983.1 hypothetical protein DMB66_47185 [Actinoplanes sp. ATCC 53533]